MNKIVKCPKDNKQFAKAAVDDEIKLLFTFSKNFDQLTSQEECEPSCELSVSFGDLLDHIYDDYLTNYPKETIRFLVKDKLVDFDKQIYKTFQQKNADAVNEIKVELYNAIKIDLCGGKKTMCISN